MDVDKPYIPVSCAIHSEYELLIMRREKIQLNWLDNNGKSYTENILPVDLKVQSGAEFLIAKNESNQQHQVRLDMIQYYKRL